MRSLAIFATPGNPAFMQLKRYDLDNRTPNPGRSERSICPDRPELADNLRTQEIDMEHNRTSSGLESDNEGREIALFGNVEWGVREFYNRDILTATVDGVLHYEVVGLCRLTEHSNPSMTVRSLADEAQTITLDISAAQDTLNSRSVDRPAVTVGPNPRRIFVNREGANRIVLDSRSERARELKAWLADDVMTSIEDTGGYKVPRQAPSLDVASLDELERLNTAFGKAIEIAKAATARAEIAEARADEFEAGAAQADMYAAADGLTTKRAFARDVQQWYIPRGVDIKHKQVYDFLAHIGLITRVAGSEHDQATAQAIKDGRARNSTKNVKMPDGTIIKVKYGKLTGKGEKYAWKRIWAAIGEHGTLDLDVIKGALVPAGADPKVIRP
jgi:anti-repressor protein